MALQRKRKGTFHSDPLNQKRFKFSDDTQESQGVRNKVNIGKSNKITSRKTRRKEERKLKKMKKAAFAQRKPIPTLETLKLEKEKQIKDAKAAKLKEKKKQKLKKKRKRQKLNKKTKSEQPPETDTRIQGLLEANKHEDKMIKQLEKQLKLNKRKSKTLPQAFISDGLDLVVLDTVDPEKASAFFEEDKEQDDLKNLDMSDSDQEIEDMMENDESETKGTSDESDQDENEDDNETDTEEFFLSKTQKTAKGVKINNKHEKKTSKVKKKVSFKEMESDIKNKKLNESTSKIQSNSSDEEFLSNSDLEDEESDSEKEENENSDDNDDTDNDIEENSESDKSETVEPKYKEDIYGRLRDEEGNVIDEPPERGAYVPPAKRALLSGNVGRRKQQLDRIQRQLKGLINRLSESNIQGIGNQIEELYRNHSRADMNESLITVIFEACISAVIIPERLVMEQALLVAILHGNVGTEVGATFLQKVALKFCEHQSLNEDTKELNNILTLLAHLYNFRVAHSLLLFDVMKKLMESFKERDIELILLLLRTVGFSLRKDDPVALKEIILQIQRKAANVDTSNFEDQSRVKFMLETLNAIKNNNMRKIPNYDPSHMEHLRKLLKNYVRVTSVSDSQLRISLEDLQNAEEKGKWWLVGSAWSGRSQDNETTGGDVSVVSSVSKDILELARKQRMNTDIRKNIFCVIMTSEDFVDAFEKLLRLGLNTQQEREIIHVIVDVSLQEKTFNPYYAYLLQKFCEYDRRFQMTLQFNSWDRYKMLSEYTEQQRSNLADLFTHLLTSKAISLSIFKVLEFSELDKGRVRFLKQVLCNILLKNEDYTIKEVFSRIASLPKLAILREGLVIFMKHFILKKQTTGVIAQRIQIAEKALSSSEGYPSL